MPASLVVTLIKIPSNRSFIGVTLPMALTKVMAVAMLVGISTTSHACTLPKSYYKNVSCTASSSYFLAVKDSGAPVALIGKDGKKKVDLFRYTQVDASKLREGLMPVQRAGKVGYVNTKGREVIPAVYDLIIGDVNTSGWARGVYDGRIVVKKDGKFGVISTNGTVIVPFSSKYRTILDYKNGVAEAQTKTGLLWLDKRGRQVKNPNAKPVEPTKSTQPASAPKSVSRSNRSSNNSLANQSSKAKSPPPKPAAPIAKDTISVDPFSAKWDIPDETLKQNPFTDFGDTPSNVTLNPPASVTPWQPAQRDGKWGYVTSQNVPMITFSFDAALPFSEGLAGVRVAQNWGFVNLAGDLVIPFRFDEAGVIREGQSYRGQPPFTFVQGKAWIGNLNNGDKLCVDKQGTNVPCE